MKHFKKMSALFMSLVLAAGIIILDTSVADAAGSWDLWMDSVGFVGQDWGGFWVGNDKTGENAEVISVKSTEPKILKVVKHEEDGNVFWTAAAKKPGKVTLKVKYKRPDGRKASLKKKITIKKYPNQIKSLKINGKKVKIADNKFFCLEENVTSSKIKVDLKLKKGWKIRSVNGNLWNAGGNGSKVIKKAKSHVKNGDAIKFPKKYRDFELMIGMTDGEDSIMYHIRISRDKA